MKKDENDVMEKIVSLAKRRGFIFQGSEIYGGLAGTWDYGPYGVALKNNIKNLWWKQFVDERDDIYGIDAGILMNQKVWEASGHVGGFSDPLVECENCKKRYRVDQIVDEDKYKNYIKNDLSKDLAEHDRLDSFMEGFEKNREKIDKLNLSLKEKIKMKEDVDKAFDVEMSRLIKLASSYLGKFCKFYLNQNISCEVCGKNNWGEPREFNMMFKTNIGATASEDAVSYLRPETAQGIFVNFKNIVDSFHPKLPFGIAQIGKAFRNEIAPRDFVFRTREFEQMEIEYFVKESEWEEQFMMLQKEMWTYMETIGLPKERISELDVAKEDRAHYSKKTIDFEFEYPFGKKELYGLAYRTNYDLSKHAEHAKAKLQIVDEEDGPIVPHVIEPSLGVDRTVLALLTSAYTEDELGGEARAYLKLSPNVAPVKVAVFPLLKNKPELVEKAQRVYKKVTAAIPNAMFDSNGNIGKRYRRQDEIGTPLCVTVDFETVEDGAGVTVRDRDTGEQVRVQEDELMEYLEKKLA